MPTRAQQTSASAVKLHIEDTGGNHDPVVLIHGWPLSGESWKAQVLALCEEGYRVVTYDRRGFGRSAKPETGYDYDTLAADLKQVIDARGLKNVTLVGFSMGGGEVARYLANYAGEAIRAVVYAAAVPPYLFQSADNPDGPLTQQDVDHFLNGLHTDRDRFFADFIRLFYSADHSLTVSQQECEHALTLAKQSGHAAAIACVKAFALTDFRQDLTKIVLPTLVIHGDADAAVPLAGSGARTHKAIPGSRLSVIPKGPHGINVSHAERFNQVLLDFLRSTRSP